MTTARLDFGSNGGTEFLVSAGIVYEIIAAACSSPQTTEINADTRSDTLMKWVYLGIAQAAGFIIAASFIDKEHAPQILTGGAVAGLLLYIQYAHARKSGLENPGPRTEH